MAAEFGHLGYLDFGLCEEEWHRKRGIYTDGPMVPVRAGRFLHWLAARPERHIAVVGHHNIFLAMLRLSFGNCEVRSYTMAGGALQPLAPQPSTCDAELSEAERRHAEIYGQHNRGKLALWGLPPNEGGRWR